ncbi:hypothetical protein Y947_004138 [Salmonella enterica]|nr:hypothetical protein [Salmonella enterica]EDW4548816.1 hypothetical protein [Salmonella enterica subsp. salamae]
MGNQSKPHVFGCQSSHRITNRTKKTQGTLSISEFLALDEIKLHRLNHPEAVKIIDGEVYLSEALTILFLHLSGNKKLKKEFKRALRSGRESAVNA